MGYFFYKCMHEGKCRLEVTPLCERRSKRKRGVEASFGGTNPIYPIYIRKPYSMTGARAPPPPNSSNPGAAASIPFHNGRSRRKLQIPCLAYGGALRFLMLFPFPSRATVTFLASSGGGSVPTHLSHASVLRGAIRFGCGAREGNREIRSHLLVRAEAI